MSEDICHTSCTAQVDALSKMPGYEGIEQKLAGFALILDDLAAAKAPIFKKQYELNRVVFDHLMSNACDADGNTLYALGDDCQPLLDAEGKPIPIKNYQVMYPPEDNAYTRIDSLAQEAWGGLQSAWNDLREDGALSNTETLPQRAFAATREAYFDLISPKMLMGHHINDVYFSDLGDTPQPMPLRGGIFSLWRNSGEASAEGIDSRGCADDFMAVLDGNLLTTGDQFLGLYRKMTAINPLQFLNEGYASVIQHLAETGTTDTNEVKPYAEIVSQAGTFVQPVTIPVAHYISEGARLSMQGIQDLYQKAQSFQEDHPGVVAVFENIRHAVTEGTKTMAREELKLRDQEQKDQGSQNFFSGLAGWVGNAVQEVEKITASILPAHPNAASQDRNI